MASHHHHYHPLCHHPSPTPTPTPAVCNCPCCCYPTYTPCHHHHAPLPPPPPPPPYSSAHLYPDLESPLNPPPYREHYQDRLFEDGWPSSHATVSSLLRRISTLESSLRSRGGPPSRSLRDAAARTIQTHFRAFLCRRSRTLRQLRDLAAIKSTLGALKSLVSKTAPFDYDVVCRKAVNLLFKLDVIQGDDPLIRNGKSALAVELNKFLDLIDGICAEGSGVVKVRCSRRGDLKSRVSNAASKLENRAKSRGSKEVNVEKLRALAERIDKLSQDICVDEEEDEVTAYPSHESAIRKQGDFRDRSGVLVRQHGGAQSKAKKNVSFVENGKVYQVLRRHPKPLLEDCCDGSIDGNSLLGVEKEVEDDLCREIEEIGVSSKEAEDDDEGEGEEEEEEEAHLDNEGSLVGSGIKDSRSYGRHARRRLDQDSVDDFVFRPPLPVKMEMRGDSHNKR